MNLEAYIRDVPDFPEPGIIFKDITPLLSDPKSLNQSADQLYDLVKDLKIDKVVGIESRGFIFAPILASRLRVGFVPARKKGKLPFTTISESYGLEYGSDEIEIHSDAIERGDRVLVHDDILATGGTAKAVCNLVERLGGKVVHCNFLIQLDFLNGKQQLKGYEISSLLHY